MRIDEIIKGLSGDLLDCNCEAYGRCECGCQTVWPEDLTEIASDLIFEMRDLLKSAREDLMYHISQDVLYTGETFSEHVGYDTVEKINKLLNKDI